jgi:hypothetical protein
VIDEERSGQPIVMELPNFLYRRYKFHPGEPIRIRISPDKFCVMEY